jgi:glutamine amidotransferase-like uncharacterized protein
VVLTTWAIIQPCAVDGTSILFGVLLWRRSHSAYEIQVHTIAATEIRNGDWREDTALLVLPGGADLPYCQDLAGVGNQHICGAHCAR